ncbi:MAG: gluconate 2-dehydrogenase subunit 3 family protein [Planctomycetia bacterium]|nr:gluconate 2-dehydrogenase subunit 3 family protein [Planctomycetia bacterium]
MLNPDVISVTDKYINKKINRRSFLLATGVFAGSVTFGSLLAYYYKNSRESHPFNKSQDKILQDVQEQLFPKSNDAPGASDINSLNYLHFVLTDPDIDEDNKNLLISGVDWLEEECQTTFNKSFSNLLSKEKDKVFRIIEKSNWGYRWLSLNLIYIFEALLSDPIYGGNPDEIGWRWLEHVPGFPRPNADNMYGKL